MTACDLTFILNTTILTPIAAVLSCVCASSYKIIDCVYEQLFLLKAQEVSGFRRMRLITQLLFETLIQLAVQIHILYYFKQHPEEAADLGIRVHALFVSICIATVHAALEGVILLFEARACRASLISYCIICYNGRFGWVPFIDRMIQLANNTGSSSKEWAQNDLCYDFDSIAYRNQYLSVKIEYKFSTAEMIVLCKKFAGLPQMTQRFMVRLGKCVEDLPIDDLLELMSTCRSRVHLELPISKSALEGMFRRSPTYHRALEK